MQYSYILTSGIKLRLKQHNSGKVMIWVDTTGDESTQARILSETTLLQPPLKIATKISFLSS